MFKKLKEKLADEVKANPRLQGTLDSVNQLAVQTYSNFTKEVFKDTFPRLNRIQPAVLYPSLATAIFQVLKLRRRGFENSIKLPRRKAADQQNFLPAR